MTTPRPIPRFPVSVVGSWPRPDWLLQAMKQRAPDLQELRDRATLLAIEQQEQAGVDVLTDGEQRRDASGRTATARSRIEETVPISSTVTSSSVRVIATCRSSRRAMARRR
jgi:methionine synthase II (cobalamin-independent)